MGYYNQKIYKRPEESLEDIDATLTELTGGMGGSLYEIQTLLERIAAALERLIDKKDGNTQD